MDSAPTHAPPPPPPPPPPTNHASASGTDTATAVQSLLNLHGVRHPSPVNRRRGTSQTRGAAFQFGLPRGTHPPGPHPPDTPQRLDTQRSRSQIQAQKQGQFARAHDAKVKVAEAQATLQIAREQLQQHVQRANSSQHRNEAELQRISRLGQLVDLLQHQLKTLSMLSMMKHQKEPIRAVGQPGLAHRRLFIK